MLLFSFMFLFFMFNLSYYTNVCSKHENKYLNLEMLLLTSIWYSIQFNLPNRQICVSIRAEVGNNINNKIHWNSRKYWRKMCKICVWNVAGREINVILTAINI